MMVNKQSTTTFGYSWRPLTKMLSAGLVAGASLWLTACGGDSAKQETAQGDEQATTLADAPKDDWNMHGKDYSAQRFSALKQVTSENVNQLTEAWEFNLNNEEAQQVTPLVVDGVMYISTANGPRYVYALDAKTGEKKWEYSLEVPGDVARYACCGIVSRGVAYDDGRIFFGRLDGKLTALDAQSGEELWTVEVVDYKQGSVMTSPPLIVGNKVIAGFGAGEYGGRSYLSAYNVAEGNLVWRTYTVPGEDNEEVRKSWKGDSWKTGGAAPWYTGSYDPERNLVYWGTGNPSPWNAALRGPDSPEFGDQTNLYSTSTLAINPDNGKIQWHYQHTPYDAWDYDGTNELVLADLEIDGKKTATALKADRNGYFYVLNRETGKLLSANNFVKANWASSIDLASGRPVEQEQYRPVSTRNIPASDQVFPSFIGGKNWQPMSFSPETGLVYIPANHMGMSFETSDVEYQRGYFYLGAEWEMEPEDEFPGEYIAWDPIKQEKKWGIKQKFPIPGGALTTGGNLLFFGNLEGMFYAYDATTGEKKWEYKAKSGIGASPITYSVDGKQYVAIVDGRPSVIPGFIGGDLGEQIVEATPAGGTVHVFAINP